MKRILLLGLIVLGLIGGTAQAVVTSTISQNKYACNSSNTAWNYTFPIILSTDIQVWTIDQYGNPTQQTSNFSVNTTTQTVTYPVIGSPCVTGNNLLLLRVQPFTQLVAASNQGPAPSPVVMGMSDKLTMLAQQIEAQMNRAVLAPIGSTSSAGYALPSPLSNAYVGWDPTGTFLININASQNLTPGASPTFVGLTLTGLNGILKSSGDSGVGIANADVDYSVPNGVETLTNKTYDTGGTGNTFNVAGTTLGATGVLGTGKVILGGAFSGNTTTIGTTSGTFTTNHCAKWDVSGNLVDNGSSCSGGSGMVYPGTAGIPITDTSSWKTSLSEVDGDIIVGVSGAWTVEAPPTWNQSTTGSAAKWTTARNLAGNSVDGSANVQFANNFIVKGTTDSGLSGAQFLGALGTGLVKNTTTTGVLSIATAGTDYAAPTSGSAILAGNGSGGTSNVTIGTGLSFTGGALSSTVTSQFVPNNIQVFTSSGTWTKPAGVSNVYVKVVGGGGNGGNNVSGGVSYAGGGGGGGYAEGVIAVTGNVTVTIGATNSFAGTTTIQATAGSSGTNTKTGAAGGVGSNGTINLSGQRGQDGSTAVAVVTGYGGNSIFGTGGAAINNSAGANGNAYGGGGGGGFANDGGGTGDPGAVIVYY